MDETLEKRHSRNINSIVITSEATPVPFFVPKLVFGASGTMIKHARRDMTRCLYVDDTFYQTD